MPLHYQIIKSKKNEKFEKNIAPPFRHTLRHATPPPCKGHTPSVCPCIIKLLNLQKNEKIEENICQCLYATPSAMPRPLGMLLHY